jgi:hypothetical protein
MKSIDEKISTMLRRYMKKPSQEELNDACERNLQKFLDTAAAMKQQQPDSVAESEGFEEILDNELPIMVAIYLLRDEARFDTIQKMASDLANREVRFIEVSVVLVDLMKHGLIVDRLADDPRRNKPVAHYSVTASGELALKFAVENTTPQTDYLRGLT